MIQTTIRNKLCSSPHIKNIDFAIYGEDKVYHTEDFELSLCENENGFAFEGENDLFSLKWSFTNEAKGFSVSLSVDKKEKIVYNKKNCV